MKKKIAAIFLLCVIACKVDTGRFTNRRNLLGDIDGAYPDDAITKIVNDTDKIRVALLLPMTGAVKNIGESLLNAAQLSIINNNKKKILLRVYDTNGTTFGAVKAVNGAIADGVDVVVGPLLSAETQAIKNIAVRNNLLVFSLSNDQSLANISNVFVTGSIPEQEIQLLISYLTGSDIHNYVAFLPNNDHGANINKILRTVVAGKDGLLIKSDYYDEKEQNTIAKLTDLVNYYEIPQTLYDEYQKKKTEQKLLGAKGEVQFIIRDDEKIYPQCVFIADGGKKAESLASFLFVVERAGNKIQLAGASKLDGDLNILNNPYMDGVIFVGADPKKLDDFYRSYYSAYQSYPVKISSMLYDLIDIIDKIYRKTSDGNYFPDKRVLLNPFGFSGIDGKFRFLPNGIVERNLFVLQLLEKNKKVLYNSDEFLNY
ncbi:MAG: penicillin-binding protein activator [Rickettsiales bacterium]|jgi:ABC-type branched-subunit amino acid transport system substrate-binding protein|nr:penicillin-binding protein activator [Rickettsiales bacterium]